MQALSSFIVVTIAFGPKNIFYFIYKDKEIPTWPQNYH